MCLTHFSGSRVVKKRAGGAAINLLKAASIVLQLFRHPPLLDFPLFVYFVVFTLLLLHFFFLAVDFLSFGL